MGSIWQLVVVLKDDLRHRGGAGEGGRQQQPECLHSGGECLCYALAATHSGHCQLHSRLVALTGSTRHARQTQQRALGCLSRRS